ncbi:hypothetical protein ACNJ7K_10915 [Rhodococcus aetherivorans]
MTSSLFPGNGEDLLGRGRRVGSPPPQRAQLVDHLQTFVLGQQHTERGQVARLVARLIVSLDDSAKGLDIVVPNDLFPSIERLGEEAWTRSARPNRQITRSAEHSDLAP